MSIQFSQNIKFYAEKYLDSRQKFETIEEMKNFSDVPNGFICFNEETKRHYIYDMSSSFNSDLGKWKTSLLLENSINELINQQDELYLQKSKDYSHSKFSLIEHKHTKDDITYALGYTPVDESQKGEIDGIAELDSNGKVPSHQLPSYVDDVLEGTYIDKTIFNDLKGNSYSPETGKIYIDKTTNKSYRWSGSIYTIVASDLALGETMSSAYRGDRGKTAYEHSQNKHAPVNAEENTINIIKKNGEAISPVNKSIDIQIPTKTSELENDNGFVTTTDGMVSNADMLDGKHADEFSLIEHNHDDKYLLLNGGQIKSEDETLTLSGLGITGNGNTSITNIHDITAQDITAEYITTDNIQASRNKMLQINSITDFTGLDVYAINNLRADKIYENGETLDSKYASVIHSHTKNEISDFPEKLPANGGNADTIDGKHASDLQNYNNLTNKPVSMKSPYSLTLSFNGTSQLSYDGSSAKSLNITPASINASTSTHTHTNYVSNVSSSGSGNAITAISISGNNLIVTKGTSFALSSHSHSYFPLNGGSLNTDSWIRLKTTGGISGGIELKSNDGYVGYIYPTEISFRKITENGTSLSDKYELKMKEYRNRSSSDTNGQVYYSY